MVAKQAGGMIVRVSVVQMCPGYDKADALGREIARCRTGRPDGIVSIRAVIDCTVTAKMCRDMPVLKHRVGRPSTAYLDSDRAKPPERNHAA